MPRLWRSTMGFAHRLHQQESRLGAVSLPLHRSLEALRQLAGDFERPLGPPLRLLVDQLAGLIDGPDSIFAALQQAEFDQADAQQLITENVRLSKQLTSSTPASRRREQAIAEADRHALSVQRFGMGILAAIVTLSRITSGLIVWLYVGGTCSPARPRSATACWRSPVAISNRQSGGGSDEIARMAEALAVFRDTAAEVRRESPARSRRRGSSWSTRSRASRRASRCSTARTASPRATAATENSTRALPT